MEAPYPVTLRDFRVVRDGFQWCRVIRNAAEGRPGYGDLGTQQPLSSQGGFSPVPTLDLGVLA